MFHPTLGRVDLRASSLPCSRCDLLLGLDGVHVEHVERSDGLVVVTVSSVASPMGCPACGVIALGRGRRRRVLHDVPARTRVRIVWRQRVWRCDDDRCVKKTFVEQIPTLVATRGSITKRAVDWAVGQVAPRARDRPWPGSPTRDIMENSVASGRARVAASGG